MDQLSIDEEAKSLNLGDGWTFIAGSGGDEMYCLAPGTSADWQLTAGMVAASADMDDFWGLLDQSPVPGQRRDVSAHKGTTSPLPVIDRQPAGLRDIRTGREPTRPRPIEIHRNGHPPPASTSFKPAAAGRICTTICRDPYLDGLVTAEDRDERDIEVAEGASRARELAQAHLRRCASPTYLQAERRASRCATMVVRQGDDDLATPRESMLVDMLRRRSRFVAVPVAEVGGSFVDVQAAAAPGSRAIMMTAVGEEMHRKLAMQSRDDAKAYLEMLHEEGALVPPSAALGTDRNDHASKARARVQEVVSGAQMSYRLHWRQSRTCILTSKMLHSQPQTVN